MRFAKRNRGWLSGRRLFGDSPDSPSGAVATDERRALLESDGADDDADEGYREVGTGDPTQRLLTALGRFQLQVARAEAGAPQEQWCDECMNQLITGIELAVDQGWDNVMQALTDTARILHSYEKAAKASQCVPFLQDSYEILCLMVGDIIVDNVRSGVMQKWKERYQRAVDDLLRAGIALVEDEELEDDAEASAPRAPEPPARSRKTEPPAPEPAIEVSLSEEIACDQTVDEELETEDATDMYETDSPFDEPPEEPESPTLELDEEGAPLPSLDDLIESDPEEAAVEDHAEPPAETPESPQTLLMDALFTEEAPPVEAAPPKARPGRAKRAETEPLWTADTAACTETAPAPSVAPAAAPSAPAQPTVDAEADAAQALLRTTQQALSSGNVADAKVLALELAISMARLETERTETQVRAAEMRLSENESAIADAEATVRRHEQSLSDAETRVVESERELAERRQHLGSLRERIGGIESRIADLEAQIRELQAQRDEELANLETAEKEQDDAFAMESRIQTEIEQLNENCQAAQESLEESREAVARLKKDRKDFETELKESLTALAQRKQSVEQIKQTMESIRGPVAAAEKAAPGEIDQELF